MKPLFVAPLAALIAFASPLAAADNQLTDAERAAGWELLFDGASFGGWRGYRLAGLPENLGWQIADGTMHAKGVKYDMSNIPMAEFRRSELITERKFADFELVWDWKISHAGNNGLKYFVTEDRPNAPGPEYQMLDDAKHPDGKLGPHRHTASFYDVLPGAAAFTRPIGEWNTSRIIVRGNQLEHWLNGHQVIAVDLDSQEVRTGLSQSKFRSEATFGRKIAGHIMLTYHGDECWVKNFKIRETK